MFKKSITFEDYDGETRTEEYWFHLTKAEILEMVLAKGEGFEGYLKKISATNNMAKILPLFREIISKTIGERDENNRFTKPPGAAEAFMASEAYSAMFIEFVTDVPKFIEFINAVAPKEMVDQISFETGALKVPEGTNTSQQVEIVELPQEEVRPFDDYSKEELMSMSQADFDKLTTGDVRKMSRKMIVAAMQRRTHVKVVPIPKDKKFEDYDEVELLNMPEELFNRLVPSNLEEMTREQLVAAMNRKSRLE